MIATTSEEPMPNRQQTNEHRMRTGIQDRALEWFSSLVMFCWGIVLALPADTLSAPQYAAFRRFGATEEFWAISLMAIGAMRLTALYINGRWPKTPMLRMVGSLFGAVTWAQVFVLIAEGSIQAGAANTGLGVYGPLALAEVLSIYRAAFDARYYRS